MFSLILERGKGAGEEREKLWGERETSIGCPRTGPDQGIEPTALWCTGQCSHQLSLPARATRTSLNIFWKTSQESTPWPNVVYFHCLGKPLKCPSFHTHNSARHSLTSSQSPLNVPALPFTLPPPSSLWSRLPRASAYFIGLFKEPAFHLNNHLHFWLWVSHYECIQIRRFSLLGVQEVTSCPLVIRKDHDTHFGQLSSFGQKL